MIANFKTIIRLGLAFVAACIGLVATTNCGGKASTDERSLLLRADSFVVAYYNGLYHEAARFVAPSSMPRLRFIASQITQADVDVIRQREEPLSYEVVATTIEHDSCAQVELQLHNAFTIDSIGQPGTISAEQTTTLNFVFDKEQQLWFVSLSE